ncbi:MAG TPA: manganese catalase family protein [Thermomicrobiales bacterium]|nr:manganese catalase family protein [Thermomicrobiales bacterium]
MFYQDGRLQYPVRVETPSPLFAKMLQQALGGVEGEIRVALQYMFQAFGSRGPAKYRDMLLNTGTEELAHIEMLATAIALNLEGASNVLKDQMAQQDPAVAAVLGGMSPRHYLSAGLAALPTNSEGVPFDTSHVYASGNIVGDMYANVTAEATGRTLATRLYHLTDDPGMKDMLAFLIARDTMHQQQWLAVIEELGGETEVLPVPNSFPQDQENQDFNYVFLTTSVDGTGPEGRWSSGPSLDGNSEFRQEPASPLGEVPVLAPPVPEAFAQEEQMDPAAAPPATPGA